MRESCRISRRADSEMFRRRGSRKLAKKRQKFGFGKSKAELVGTQMFFGRDDYVHARHLMLMQTEEGAQDPLDTVPRNGIAAFFGDSKPKTPVSGHAGAAGEHDELFRMTAFSPVVAGGIFRPAGDSPFSGPGQ